MPKAKIISVINYKGGVGKTTTTYHIGCSLAQHYHKRVLLVDLDPQSNLTFLCAKYDRWEKFKAEQGTLATLYGQFVTRYPVNTKGVIWKAPIQLDGGRTIANLDLIPCDIEMLGDEMGLDGTTAPFPLKQPSVWAMDEYLRGRRFLVEALKQVENDYDYILLDCPPNLYVMTQNALLASDAYLVTTIPDYLSTLGFDILQGRVRDISRRFVAAQSFLGRSFGIDSIAGLGGLVFVKIRAGAQGPIAAQKTQMNKLTEKFNGLCFVPRTTEMIGYSEAAEHRVPVWEHSSANAKAAAAKEEYPQIARIFLERFQLDGHRKKI